MPGIRRFLEVFFTNKGDSLLELEVFKGVDVERIINCWEVLRSVLFSSMKLSEIMKLSSGSRSLAIDGSREVIEIPNFFILLL